MAIWKIGPALAAGNTVVLKPSELTPLTTLRLGELARDVLPAGVTHLELGGKAPVIVFDDADLAAVTRKVRTGGFWNAGQDCTAATRVLISAGRHDDLLAELVPAVSSIATAEPLAEGAEMGPVISREQQERVLGFLARAPAGGAELATGGPADGDRGFFVPPREHAGGG